MRSSSRQRTRVRPGAPVTGHFTERLEERIFFATHTWTGAVNNNWSTPGNWTGGAPAVGETTPVIVFNTVDTTVNQDIPNLSISVLRFDAGSGVTLTLVQPLTINLDDATISKQIWNASGSNRIVGSASLAAVGAAGRNLTCQVFANTTLDIGVALSGTGGLFKTSEPGTLRLSGSVANSYSGSTSASGGTLELAKTEDVNAVPGHTLTITGGAAGAPQTAVRLTAPEQIDDSTGVVVTGNAQLDLLGNSEHLTSLTLKAPAATTTLIKTGSAGRLSLAASSAVTVDAAGQGTSLMDGNFELLDPTTTFDVGDVSSVSDDLIINGVISGAGGISKVNAGTLRLSGLLSNTYSGTTGVTGGTVVLAKAGTAEAIHGPLDIGSGNAGGGTSTVLLTRSDLISDDAPVTMRAGGVLDVSEFAEKVASIEGDAGKINLASATAGGVLTAGGNNLTRSFGGFFSGAGAFRKIGTGTLTLSNPITNASLQIDVAVGSLVFGNTSSISLLSMNGGTSATLSPGATPGSHDLTVRTLAVGSNARLDLTNGGLVLDYAAGEITSLDTVRNAIKAGFANGTWTGGGVTSSVAAAESDKSLGFADNNPAKHGLGLSGFLNHPVDATSVLVRLTLDGDADLDGSVGPGDFNRLASNFGQSGAYWQTGDFTFDGSVGPGDFNLLASQFGKSMPPTVSLRAAGTSTAPSTPRGAEIAFAEAAPRKRIHAREE